MDHLDSTGASETGGMEGTVVQQATREQKRAGVNAGLLEDTVESLARLEGSKGDTSTAKTAGADSNGQNGSQPPKSPGLIRRSSSASVAKRKRRSSAGQSIASVLLLDSDDEEDQKQKPSKKNTPKATSKRKNKSNKRGTDIDDVLEASTMPFHPRRGDDSEFYHVRDLDETRLVNPLAEWPDMQHEFNPTDHKPKPSAHAAEIMPLMHLWMPIPDTFSLAYQARLLGFRVETPALIHRLQDAERPIPLPTNLQFIRETEQGEDSYEFVPPLGHFTNQVWHQEDTATHANNRSDAINTEDMRVLGDQADPLYTSLCTLEPSNVGDIAAIQLSQRIRLVSSFAKAKPKFSEMLSTARGMLNLPGNQSISSSWSFCSLNEYIKVYPNLSHLKQSKLCALMLLPESLPAPPTSPDNDDPNFDATDEDLQQAKPVPQIDPIVIVWYDFVWFNFSADQAGVILQIFDITFGSVSENQSLRSLWHESSPGYLQSLSFELQTQIILSLCAVLDHARTANVYYATVEKVPKAWAPFWDDFFRAVGVEHHVRKESENRAKNIQGVGDDLLVTQASFVNDNSLKNKKPARPAKMGVTSVLESLDGNQTSHSISTTQSSLTPVEDSNQDSDAVPSTKLQNNHISEAKANPVSVLDVNSSAPSSEKETISCDNANETGALKDEEKKRAGGQNSLQRTSTLMQQAVVESTTASSNEKTTPQLPSHEDSLQMRSPNREGTKASGSLSKDDISPDNPTTKGGDLGLYDKTIARIRVVVDLNKSNSQLALLSLKRAQSGENGRWQSPGMAQKDSIGPRRECFRSLIRFPNVNDATAMTQSNPSGRRGRPSTRRVSVAFSSAKEESQHTVIGICAKFGGGDEVVGFARLDPKTKEAVEEIKAPCCYEEPQLEVLRTFHITSPPQAQDLDDEILNQMKRLQNKVKELEIDVLEPKARNLMDCIISERMTFENSKPHLALEEEKEVISKLRQIQAKRQALVEEQQKQLEQDMDAVCSICNDGEVTPENQILFCDTCDVPVHQFCYGIDKIPSGDYYCMACRHLGRDKKGRQAFLNKAKTTAIPLPIVCELCPVQRGAFIRTEIKEEDTPDPNGKWIHAVCAKWQGLNYVNPDVLEDVTEMRMNFRREGIKCELCLGERGCMNKCSVEGCRKWLHVTCARVSGKCEVRHGEDCDGAVVEDAWQLKCPSHSIVAIKPEDRKRLVPVEKLIEIARSLPPEPTPPPKPIVVEYKAFNEATEAEQKLLLNDPKYEKMMIDELLNKRSAGIRCEVCDNPCDNRKNYIRCQMCKETICRGCLQEFDDVSGNALCFKCKNGGERPTCCACGYKHGPLRSSFAKPTSAKIWQGAKKKKLLEKSVFGTAKWIHHLCGLWHPKVGFPLSEDDPNHKKLDLSQVVLSHGRGFIQDNHPCYVCGRKYGLKVKCSPRSDCSCCWLDQEGIKHPTYFHISCARIAGLEVEENLEEMDDEGHPVGPYVRCYRHAGNEFNIRAKLEDLFEIEKTRKKPGSDRPLTFVDGARMMNSALIVVRILGWAWRWAEWWVEYDSSWEPFLEPHQKEKDMTKEELRIVDSTKESRCQDARRCRLAAFGAALRDRLYDEGDDFDREALSRAFHAVLSTQSLVGPLTDEEIDFHADWLGRAYRSKSRLLCLGEDKLPVDPSFCATVQDKTPKYEIDPARAPGKEVLKAGTVFEVLDKGDKDDFLLVKMAADEPVARKERSSSKSKGKKRKVGGKLGNGDGPPPKRTRDRPLEQKESPAILNQSSTVGHSSTDGVLPKRRPGRPPKKPKVNATENTLNQPPVIGHSSSDGVAPKRGRGRPPKNPKGNATEKTQDSSRSKRKKSAQQSKTEDPSYFREFKKSRRGIYNAPESLGGGAGATGRNGRGSTDAQSIARSSNDLLLAKALEGDDTKSEGTPLQETAHASHRIDEKKTGDPDPSDFQVKDETRLPSANVENKSTGDDSDDGFGFASIASDRSEASSRSNSHPSKTSASNTAPPLSKQIRGMNQNGEVSSLEKDVSNPARTEPDAAVDISGEKNRSEEFSASSPLPVQNNEKQNSHQSAQELVKQTEAELQTEHPVEKRHASKQPSKEAKEIEKASIDDPSKVAVSTESRRNLKGRTNKAGANIRDSASAVSDSFDPSELPPKSPSEGRRSNRSRRKPDAFVPQPDLSPLKAKPQVSSERSSRGRRRKPGVSIESESEEEFEPRAHRRKSSREQKENSGKAKANPRKTQTLPSTVAKVAAANSSEHLSGSRPPRRSTRRGIKESDTDEERPQRPNRNAGRRSTLKDPDSDEDEADDAEQESSRSKPLKRHRNDVTTSGTTRKNAPGFPGIIFPNKSAPDSDSSTSGSESDPEVTQNTSESKADNQDEDTRSDPAREQSASSDEYVDDIDREPTPPRNRRGSSRPSRRGHTSVETVRRSGRLSK